MRGKVVLIGSKAITVYYIAIGTLIALLAAFIIGILISTAHLPPCTSTTQNICGVNDWSIAGLAATILGVAATVLAFLGAFAVAAWWKDLNKTVDERVDKQVTERMEQLRQTQATELKEYVEDLFQQQRKLVADALIKQNAEIERLKAQASILLVVAMRPDIWDIEVYVRDYWMRGQINEMTQEMVRLLVSRYLRIIKSFQHHSQKHPLLPGHAMITPVECFEFASGWVERVKEEDQRVNPSHQPMQDQLLHGLASILDHDVSAYKPFVDDWNIQNPKTIRKEDHAHD